MNNYLTEENLGVFLNIYFQQGKWIHDKSFIGRLRPDYRNEFYKMIVEFDGYAHYTTSKRILVDKKKDELYSKEGYRVIRIPYFIQLSKYTIKKLFNININYEQQYPHGFIDNKCILPADFCYLGIRKFLNDLNNFSNIKDEIIESLKNKIIKLGNRQLVVPNIEELENIR